MANWKIKGTVQKILGYLPAGEQLHYALQRRMGGLSNFRKECASKIDDWSHMVGHMRTVGQPFAGATMIEVGSGWYTTFPFCSYLAGASLVYTYDLNRFLKRDLTIGCVEVIGDYLDLIVEIGDRKRDDVVQRHNKMLSTLREGGLHEEATEGCVSYKAPADARCTGLPAASIDWAFSNSVLEHIPGTGITEIMRELYRIARPGGFTWHAVNCGDHYAYRDPSITQLNYLRFSEKEWERWNNKFLYQNRLRAKELVGMVKDSGFEVVVDTTTPLDTYLRSLDRIPVASCFSKFTPEELCVTTVTVVGKKSEAEA